MADKFRFKKTTYINNYNIDKDYIKKMVTKFPNESIIQRETENGIDLYVKHNKNPQTIYDYQKWLEKKTKSFLHGSYQLNEYYIVGSDERDDYMFNNYLKNNKKYKYLIYFYDDNNNASTDPEWYDCLQYTFANTEFWVESIIEQFSAFFSADVPGKDELDAGDYMRLVIDTLPQLEWVASAIESVYDDIGDNIRVLKKNDDGETYCVYEYRELYNESNEYSEIINDAIEEYLQYTAYDDSYDCEIEDEEDWDDLPF